MTRSVFLSTFPGRRFILGFLSLFAAAVLNAQPTLEIPAPAIAAKAFVLYDPQSEQMLASQAPTDRYEPASLTKVMAAYVAFQALRDKKITLTQTVPVSEKAWRAEGSRMFIDPKKPVTVDDLLRGMIVQSGNDASIALAEAVAGSEESFVQLMNKHAQRLGLKNTNFTNSTGLPQPNHHASAEDMARLAAALIRDFPEEYKLYAQKDFTYNKITQANRNRLLWQDPTVDGMKTGHTEAAGYCLIASGKRGERRLISVVMGTASDAARAQESQKLLNFGFQFSDTRRLYKKGDVLSTPEVFKGTANNAKLGFDKDLWLTLPREKFTNLKATITTTQPLLAPLAQGQKAGIMKLTQDDKVIAEVPVVALEAVPVAGVLGRGWDAIRLLFK
jgi:serine-type D-Ala-D-Ala carboxypeptidase (penicillin-binding protein 5/6)